MGVTEIARSLGVRHSTVQQKLNVYGLTESGDRRPRLRAYNRRRGYESTRHAAGPAGQPV